MIAEMSPMIDSPEVIREQMEVTRSQLSDKLESLESQVAGTVQSASTAVTETVEAVQDAVHSVSHAFDLHRQIESHPWRVIGGSVVLGYLAYELLGTPESPVALPPEASRPTPRSPMDFADRNGASSMRSTAKTAPTPDMASGSAKQSDWDQVKLAAVGAFIGIASNVASRAVPLLIDYLIGQQTRGSNTRTDESK